MELSTPLSGNDGYRQLLQQISETYIRGRVRAVQAVNAQLIEPTGRWGATSSSSSRPAKRGPSTARR